MRICATASLFFAFSSTLAQAEDLNRCVSIENDLDRLACYDSASGREKTTVAVENVSDWDVRIDKSKLTDETNVFLSVQSLEEVSCGWRNPSPVILMLRCMEDTTALMFITACHMTSSRYDTYGDVDFRLDKDPAKKISFQDSTNNKALGLWRGRKSIPVIKSMFGKSSLVVRITPFGESPFTAEFPIAGIEDAIEPLRKACGW